MNSGRWRGPRDMLSVHSPDTTRIAYEKTGSGPALILVDGALCYRDCHGGGKLAALLADRFTVYTYDRRGRGESGDTAPYAVVGGKRPGFFHTGTRQLADRLPEAEHRVVDGQTHMVRPRAIAPVLGAFLGAEQGVVA